jgi:hypothetical protein
LDNTTGFSEGENLITSSEQQPLLVFFEAAQHDLTSLVLEPKPSVLVQILSNRPPQ